MSDELVGRYRRVYVRIWDDPKFRALSPNEQRLTLYMLSGPQTNRIGLFKFSVPRAADDLNLGIGIIRKALANICVAFGWLFDSEARVVYLPSWWRWNLAVNTNIFLGNLRDLSELPSCAFVEAFAQNTTYVPPKLLETFIEALQSRLPKASRTSGSVALSGALSGKQEKEKRAGFETKNNPVHQPAKSEGFARLATTAREVLSLTNGEPDVDCFFDVHRRSGQPTCSKTEALEALTVALAERRTM